ncbi:hypothetical protein [Bradyrhizobium genosp. A]|uniref:hypothetical protein n=1 Tax=Bradyrhizobium genosp. A TaxID=83626 RepID=UPI003CE9F92B
METARLADRQEGASQSKPLVQASFASAVVDGGRQKAAAACKGQYAHWRHELKLQRPIAAIRSKAHQEGISLKPINRSTYNRRAAKTRAVKRR